jgi:cobalt/nickel transport system ATP-binding protein
VTAITARADTLGYVADVPVLREVHLEARVGEAIAVLGGNGAGKTALLHFIAGALSAKTGGVTVHGRLIASARDAMRAGVGLVVQDPDDQLLGATVREDVALGPRNLRLDEGEVSTRVESAIATVGIAPLIDRDVESLSFGERKRACLAGVLAMHPRVLLLDEPTAGLDPLAEIALCETLRGLAACGTTLVVATHAVDLVPRFATRVVLLGEKRILFDGAMSDLIAESALLARASLRRPWPAQLWLESGARVSNAPPPPLTMEEAVAWLTPLFS